MYEGLTQNKNNPHLKNFFVVFSIGFMISVYNALSQDLIEETCKFNEKA